MNSGNKNKHTIDFIFPIAVLFVFMASAFAVLVLSANFYSKQTKRATDNYSISTPLTYITEKIRQHDVNGAISIETINGHDCLTLSDYFEDGNYTLYIYEYEGMLKELLLRNGIEASLSDGTDIMEIHQLTMEETSEGLFRFSSKDSEGFETSLLISERSSS